MSSTLALNVGERYYFTKEESCALLDAGKVDVYVGSSDGAERFYLRQFAAPAYIFPLQDEITQVEIFFHVRENAQLTIYPQDEITALCSDQGEALRQGMHGWLAGLLKVEWLAYFENHADEYVGQWRSGKFLYQASAQEVCDIFSEHQSILALLINGQFHAQEKYFADRLRKRQENKVRLIDEAVENLIDRPLERVGSSESEEEKNYGQVKLVREALKYFSMEEVDFGSVAAMAEELTADNFLKYLLRKAGIRFRPVLFETDWSKSDSGVFILRYKGAFALALPLSANSYELVLIDGQRIALTEEMLSATEPKGLQIYAGLPPRALTTNDLYRFIYKQCWREDYQSILLTSFFIGIIPILTPIITQTIFSDVIPIHDYRSLATITQVMLISSITIAITTIVRSIAVVRLNSRMGLTADAALFSRLLNFPIAFYKKLSIGELTSRISAFSRVRSILTGDFISSCFNAVFSFWSLILMLYYSWKLAFICCLIWIVYLIVTLFVHRNLMNYQRESIKTGNELSTHLVQIFNGLSKFRNRGGEAQAYLIWSKYFSKSWQANLRLRWQSNYNSMVQLAVPYILMLVLYGLVITWQKDADAYAITISDFMAFNSAYGSFNTALSSMVGIVVNYMSIPAHLENLKPILDQVPEDLDDKANAPHLTGDIELRNISFAYADGPEVIHSLSLHIKPGERVAIVGTSGCGKSTLMRIVLGFEKVTKGEVLYDGLDINDLNLASIRRQMGVVLQDGKLLTGRILDNIIGTTGLTLDDAWEAARKVALDKDIEEMPMGMHTMVNEGSTNISGGQRQRILLARSLVGRPQIIILDEATSALDNTTQAIVATSLEKMHCTQIIVAHRLSTIRYADRIFVMDAGKIVEEGNYDELMEQNGIFAALARRQLT